LIRRVLIASPLLIGRAPDIEATLHVVRCHPGAEWICLRRPIMRTRISQIGPRSWIPGLAQPYI